MKSSNTQYLALYLLQKTANLNLENIKKTMDLCVPIFTIIGVVLGGGYTLFQYQKQQQMRHEDKTVELYMKQFQEPFIDYHRQLDIKYDPKKSKEFLNVLYSEKNNYSKNLNHFRDFILKFSEDKTEQIMMLTDFYEGIASCANIGVCDKQRAKELFAKDGKEFFVTFSPYFCELRKKWKDDSIALELEKFYSPSQVQQNFDFKAFKMVSESKVCDAFNGEDKVALK